MKKKIINLIKKIFASEWSPAAIVIVASILGYAQSWFSLIFIGLVWLGTITVSNNKTVEPTKVEVKKVK
jgi:hypothetical protein